MTWLQIFYIVGLYFGLAEALFRHVRFDNDLDSFVGSFIAGMKDESIGFSFFLVVGYLLWPAMYIIAVYEHRKERIEAVTRKLAGS